MRKMGRKRSECGESTPKAMIMVGMWKTMASKMIIDKTHRRIRELRTMRWRREYRTRDCPVTIPISPVPTRATGIQRMEVREKNLRRKPMP